jgi:hypothetical protein
LVLVEAHRYWFNLKLTYKEGDKADRERVRKLVGSWGKKRGTRRSIEAGILIPLKITISVSDSSGAHPVLEKEVLVGDVYAYGNNYFLREIEYIEIPAGRCRITVQSLKNIPELAYTEVILRILYNRVSKP